MQEGSFISDTDVSGMRKDAVLGPQVVSDLWPNGQDPIGQSIMIKGVSFIVSGITVSKGGSGFANKDDTVYIPLSTAQEIVFGHNYLTSISVSATSQDTMTAAENQIGYLLLQRHHFTDPSQADFSIISQSDIESAASSTTGTFTALLSGIAAISLLVGGIGIMNIMLVTVTERIREIGLRKALGARKSVIITQFLSETIMLTFVGGILGMVLGIGLSFIISLFINLPFTLSIGAVFLAIGVSGGIGIIFGWYPAQRAASLSPIEALRYE
jgi:putative ABC transport system permease protein